MLVEKIGCETGPSRKETCMDGFETCYIRGDEAGSMEVTDNLPLACAVVDTVCSMDVGLMFHTKISEFVNHEVLTGAWWRRPIGGFCG